MNKIENRTKIHNAIRRRLPVRNQFQISELPYKLEKDRATATKAVSGGPVRPGGPASRPGVTSGAALKAPSLSDPVTAAASNARRTVFIWQLTSYVRIRLSLFFITAIALTLIFRLYTLQVQESGSLSKRAADLHMQKSEIPARRGIIRDTNGLVLASNITLYQVWGAPQGLTEKQAARDVAALGKLLPDVQPAKLQDALTYSDKTKVYNLIASNVDSATADKIRELGLPGVYLESKMRRIYPNGSLMGPLLGFDNYENVGAYGIEGNYDEVLKGKPGILVAERDRDGNPIVLGQRQISDPEDGGDLTLTIDSAIQWMVERELKKGMVEHQAEAATAIVMDPKTGAILAWASFPNYDPNEFYKTDPSLLKDPVVSSTYEPGSTFKILTAAIGIDTGVITPDSWADLPGCVIKYSQRICNYNSVGYIHQTVIDTLEHSSNVGAMWIAEKFGPQKYYSYLKNFGIGSPTGIDVQGEVDGIVRWPESKNWIPLDMLTNAFGQSVAVTPVQVVTAISTVANGGKLMRPFLVSKITRDNKVIKENTPQVVRQVIRPESAKTTTDMLVQAVRKGETRLADVQGYRVAGKTGTSTLYDSPLTIGSTVAYAPADDPRFLVYVRYDKTKDTPWGSNSAAPVVKIITENLFDYFNIPPSEPVNSKNKPKNGN